MRPDQRRDYLRPECSGHDRDALGTQNVIRGIVKLLCGALKAIYEKGLRIPEDISFISYGKPEFSPDMTTSEFFSLTSCKMGGSMI